MRSRRVLVTSYRVFFFFQAEDGIRDIGVTGVQTCALPILRRFRVEDPAEQRAGAARALQAACEFVEGFADAPDGSLTAPLRALTAALADLQERKSVV